MNGIRPAKPQGLPHPDDKPKRPRVAGALPATTVAIPPPLTQVRAVPMMESRSAPVWIGSEIRSPIRRFNVDIFVITGFVVVTFDDALVYDGGRSFSDHSFMIIVEVGGGADRGN